MNESNFKMSIGLGMQLSWWSVCLAHIMNKTLHSIQHHASQPWWLTRGILALKNWVQEYQVSKAIRLQLHSRFKTRRGYVRTYLFFFNLKVDIFIQYVVITVSPSQLLSGPSHFSSHSNPHHFFLSFIKKKLSKRKKSKRDKEKDDKIKMNKYEWVKTNRKKEPKKKHKKHRCRDRNPK